VYWIFRTVREPEENTQILDTNVQEKCVDFKEGYVIMSFIYVFY